MHAKYWWSAIPLLLFIGILFFFWRGLSLEPQKLVSVQVGKILPNFKLPSLNNNSSERFLTKEKMHGKFVLLNVWASWCAACVEEQVFLMQLARQGVAIYGLNYKDRRRDAKQFLLQWGDPYKIVGEDVKGTAAIDLGVYGAPETFLINSHGLILYRYAGILNQQIWVKDFLPRLKGLKI